MTLRLYDYFRSSTAYRVRIALNLKKLPYEAVPVNLLDGAQRSDEHRARNPQALVPVLDTGNGLIRQSLAIIDWLDATWPEPPLLPRDPMARARALEQALLIACDIHPVDNLRVLQYLDRQLGVEKPARDAWYRHWVAEGLAALEAMADDTPFLGGDAPGLADICLVPQMYNARRFAVPLDDFPKLVRIDAAAAALPAFAEAHPDHVQPAG